MRLTKPALWWHQANGTGELSMTLIKLLIDQLLAWPPIFLKGVTDLTSTISCFFITLISILSVGDGERSKEPITSQYSPEETLRRLTHRMMIYHVQEKCLLRLILQHIVQSRNKWDCYQFLYIDDNILFTMHYLNQQAEFYDHTNRYFSGLRCSNLGEEIEIKILTHRD